MLKDINSFVSFTKEMNEDFALNQVVRVIDEIATAETSVFNNNYLGKVKSIWAVRGLVSECQYRRIVRTNESKHRRKD